MKIVFMGTPDFAVTALRALIENHQVTAVITQPDKPKGRGKKMHYTPVKEIALAHGIEVLQPVKIKDPEFIEKLKSIPADLFVVAAYGQLLSKEILYMPKYGSINIHASLLPKYRGASPIQQAIINGDKISGITIQQMDEGLDTGDILLKRKIAIEDVDTGGTLHDKLSALGAEAIIEAVEHIENRNIKREKQDNSQFTYAPLIKKEDGNIDWRKTDEEIINLIRGLNPWPVAYSYLNKKDMFKLYSAEKYEGTGGTWGEITEILPKKGIVVKTGSGHILIKEIQAPNSKKMAVSDYLRGHQIEVNSIFSTEKEDTEA